LVFPDVFGVVEVREELRFVLNIASDDGGVRVYFLNFLLGSKVVLFTVGVSVVIVLDWSGEE